MDVKGPPPILAVRQYSWRGNHVGYLVEGRYIPKGNDDFGRIESGIRAGTHYEKEPEIKAATKVLTDAGVLTGYNTSTGFIPNDSGNHLFQILQAAIQKGACQVAKSLQYNIRTHLT
jgi:hypothetical protein